MVAGNQEEANGFAIIAFVLSVFFIYRQGGKLGPCSLVPALGPGDTGPPPSCSPRLPGGGHPGGGRRGGRTEPPYTALGFVGARHRRIHPSDSSPALLLPAGWPSCTQVEGTGSPRNDPLFGRSSTPRWFSGQTYDVRVSLAVEQTCFLWPLFITNPETGGPKSSLRPTHGSTIDFLKRLGLGNHQ